MTRHLLLVGRQREVHAKVQRPGVKLSLLLAMPMLRTLKNLAIYDRIIGLPETASGADWVKAARWVHQQEAVDAIGGFQEITQGYAAVVARALDLPFHTPEVIRYTRQKDEMRQVLREAGLDTTHSRLVASAEEIVAFGAAHGYPLVLKPVDGRGSVGISIIRSPQDVPAALAWFGEWSPEHRMLVEQFLEGPEWSVEAFSEGGRHRVVCVTQKFKDPTTSVETGHCLPAPLPPDTRTRIERFVGDVLTALGFENGPSHTEIILTADGPRIVETHTRLAGDSIVDLIRLASGVDLDELWIRQTLGERVLEQVPSRLDRFAAISFVTPRAIGTLERVEGVNEASHMVGVESVEVLQEPGTLMQGVHDSFSRGACVIATADTDAEAVARARQAADALRFVVSCAA